MERRARLSAAAAEAHEATTIVLLGVVGIGNALIDVSGFTLLARLTGEAVLARMFAGFEAILTLGVAAGSLVTPLVIELIGVRLALVAIGLLAPLAVAASWLALGRLDDEMRVRDADIETLRAVPMLETLPVPTVEQLAAALEHADVKPVHTLVGRASAAITSTSCDLVAPTCCRTGGLCGRLAPGSAARSRCCTTARGPPPSGPPLAHGWT